jgi:DNA-binding GntR family transcriptional regulator
MNGTPPATDGRIDERDTSTDAIYAAIRDGICLGDYRRGSVLSENALAAEYGVSRTPIRRVLQRLEHEGLVVTKDGLGTIVKILDVVSLKEIYDLRIKLAELLAPLSPNARVTDGHLEYLGQLLQLCRAMYDPPDARELVRLNLAWHRKQMELVTNRPLRRFFSQLYYQTVNLWLDLLPTMDWAAEVRAMEEEYTATIEALRRGDLNGAALVRRDHIERSLQRIRSYLGGT